MPDKIGEKEFRNMVPGDCPARGSRIAAVRLGAGRVWDVREERQQLHRREAEPDHHGGERHSQAAQHGPNRVCPRSIPERQVERKDRDGDAEVVRQLEMSQDREAHGEGEQRIAQPAFVPERDHERQERERERGGREQLAIVPR